MDLEGYYINLDRSAERRAMMELQLRDVGLAGLISRFVAIDGHTHGPFPSKLDNAVQACRQSHEKVIAESARHSATLVLEDDIDISATLTNMIYNGEIGGYLNNNPHLDLLFLECAPLWSATPKLIGFFERAKYRSEMGHNQECSPDLAPRTVFILDSLDIYAYCAAAYIATPQGKEKLAKLFVDPNYKDQPIDQLFRQGIQTGAIVSQILVPFLAAPRLGIPSSMLGPEDDPEVGLIDKTEGFWANVTRRLLFAGFHGLDLINLTHELGAALPPVSPEYNLAVNIFGRMMLNG